MIYWVPERYDMLFPGAEDYRQRVDPTAVREHLSRYFPYSERHVQALWFDDSLRPDGLKTLKGESVSIENSGRWNLEAGPDFRGAVLRIGRDGRRVAGDAEVHIFSNDWKNHGHHTDHRYENVRFHITWFDGPVDESLFPPGTVHLSLCNCCLVDLESIDVTAYPYHEPRAFCSSGGRIAAFPMLGNSPAEIVQALEDAGMERMRQKTQRMAWLIQERGEAQVLYEEVAAAFGYKNNKAPFRKLARIVPLVGLAQYDADWKTMYAVMLGIAGLLPKQPGAGWPEASKQELRSLWDCWWREEHRWEDAPRLTRSDWNFAGLRPLNHPVRRLCALAQWVSSGFFAGDAPVKQGVELPCEACFWSTHIGWTGKEKRAELVGRGRMQAIELNVLTPFRLAKMGSREAGAAELSRLHVEPMNSVIKETAYTLFGPDHSPTLYRSALARQGLMQIFNDFILTGRLSEFG